MALGIIYKLVGLILGLILAVFLKEVYIVWELKYLAKKHNTKPPFRESSFPLGINNFLRGRKGAKEHASFQLIQKRWEALGGHDTVHGELLAVNRILTRDPENVKTILATNFKDYSLGRRHAGMYPLLGDGIFTLSGEGWKHSRALLRPQFSRQQVSQLKSLNSHVNQLISNFKRDSAKDNGRGLGYFDSQIQYHDLTLDTATEFLFGESVDALANGNREVQGPEIKVTAKQFALSFNASLRTLLFRLQAAHFSFLINPKSFQENVKICHNFVDYFVFKALAETETEDEKKQTEGEEELSYVFIKELAKQTRDPKVIRDQSFNILLAGRDTTASLLSFCTFLLSRDKRVWNKLRKEVLDTFGTDTEGISFETLKRCTYLNNTINEVLRMYPIVPFNARTAIRDTILPRGGGPDESAPVFVKKGTPVAYSVFSMHHHKKFWGEDADDFRPERWEENKLHMWDYLPFNGGPRICLGQQFALTETSFTLVRLIQTFKDIEPHPGSPASYKDIKGMVSLTASVSDGVWVKFIE